MDDLYSYGVSLGFQEETCKDGIQDIFYKLYISKDKLHHIKNVTAYLFKSYKHQLIDLSRKTTREENLESATGSFVAQVTVLDNMIDGENIQLLKDKVTKLLNRVNEKQREVVYLKYMIGLEHKEIAEILNIQEESARKLLYRTMEKLREIAAEEKIPEGLLLLFLLFLSR